MTPTHGQRGFTLLELLIATAVFAVMSAMAYGGLSSVISTQQSIDVALDRSKTLQMATWRIQRDIEQIVDRPVRDQYGDRQPPIVGDATNGLQFTRDGWTNPLGEIRSNLQRVAYRVDDEGNLQRAYWRVLDRSQGSQPVESTLLTGVTRIEWRYLDPQRQWQDRWPPDSSTNLSDQSLSIGADGQPRQAGAQTFTPPLAIELRLDTKTWGKLRLLFMIPGAQS